MNIIKRTIDNSYVIVKNGLPYHVPNEGEFTEEWAEVNAYAEAHPDEVELEEPYVPSEEEIAEAEEAAAKAAQEAANAAARELILDKLVAEAAQRLDFTEEEYAALALSDDIFPEWTAGATYNAGTRLTHTADAATVFRTARGGENTVTILYQTTKEVLASDDNPPHLDTESYVALSLPSAGNRAPARNG